MKICHISDLHLEYETLSPPTPNADVIVLSGDIHRGVEGIKWASQLSLPVVYILGNNEFHGSSMERLIDQCYTESFKYDNVYFLENDCAVIENVRFHGCTLWTDFCLYQTPDISMEVAKANLNDYQRIRYRNTLFTPKDAKKKHHESRRWLLKSIHNSPQNENIIVTHHLPSKNLIQKKFIGSELCPAFASHCDEFQAVSDKVSIWLFGHNHDCQEQVDFNIWFHTNQRGKSGNKRESNFNPLKVIDIPILKNTQ